MTLGTSLKLSWPCQKLGWLSHAKKQTHARKSTLYTVGKKLWYHNDPKFLDRLVWANSEDPEKSDQVLHCLLFSLHGMRTCR